MGIFPSFKADLHVFVPIIRWLIACRIPWEAMLYKSNRLLTAETVTTLYST